MGPIKLENEAVKGWAQCLLQVEPTSCHIFTNKERNSNSSSPQTCQRQLVFHSKLLQHFQLISTFHFTRNYRFWYCSRSRLLNKSSKTIGNSQDTWELGKYDKKPMTHVHFSPKRTQGVAPRPRLVRVLLSLCGSDLRSVVWWRGVSPEILATIKLLSPGLLGGTVTGLWNPRSIETCMAWPFIENQPTKH